MDSFESRREARTALYEVGLRLIAEFGDLLPAGTVLRHLAAVREELLRAGVRTGLAETAESMARRRLATMTPVHA